MKILLGILAAFVLLVGGCSMLIYKSATSEYPDYAKKEVVDVQYADLISSIKSSVESSDSRFDLLASLEKINYPENTIYVGVQAEDSDDNEFVVLKKFKSGSSSTFLMNGYGHGSINEQKIIIFSVPNENHGLEDVVVYLTPK